MNMWIGFQMDFCIEGKRTLGGDGDGDGVIKSAALEFMYVIPQFFNNSNPCKLRGENIRNSFEE